MDNVKEMTKDSSTGITFRTKDLNQAAFLWCQENTKLAKIQCEGEKTNFTVFFVFTLMMADQEFVQLQIKHANGDTLVEPKKFCDKQSTLRDLMFNAIGIEKRNKQ